MKNDRKRVMIVGTGSLAEKLFRELKDSVNPRYEILGFIENRTNNSGMKIHGVPILGTLEDIASLVKQYEIDDILIAGSEHEKIKIQDIIEYCTGIGVRFKCIPSFNERMLSGVKDHLRDIQVEDLLARDPISLNMDLVRQDLEGKTVLITGAGGSIGSELARQILKLNPRYMILMDNSETPLYRIDMELQGIRPLNTLVIPSIGDIRSTRSMERIIKKWNPDVLYHAAAYKHVPMMELSPIDAVNNNIIGTFKLSKLACKYHIKKFVMISTDKAVKPSSTMGATKRVAEMIVQSMNGNGTQFCVVRFGNVLGSNGSVVPLFEKQIANGGPVTVTHPDIIRFFMTIPEAVMLVLQAGSICKGGEIFLLDMGEPIKILDLAKNMIRLAGLIPDKDIKIEFIGLRPGEKLYEELLMEGENVIDTSHDKIKICSKTSRISEKALFEGIEHLILLVQNPTDNNSAKEVLMRLVPDYLSHTQEFKIQKSAEIDFTENDYKFDSSFIEN